MNIHYIAVASGKEYGIEVDQLEEYNGNKICSKIAIENNVKSNNSVITFELFQVYLSKGELKRTFKGTYEIKNKITSESQYNDVVNLMLVNNVPIEFHNFIKNESLATVKRLLVISGELQNISQANSFAWQQAVESAENMIKSLIPAIQNYTKECERIARSNAAYAASDLH